MQVNKGKKHLNAYHHLQNLALDEDFGKYFRESDGNVKPYKRPEEKSLVVVVKENSPERSEDWVNVAHIALAGVPTLPKILNTYNAIKDIKEKHLDHKVDIAGWSSKGL